MAHQFGTGARRSPVIWIGLDWHWAFRTTLLVCQSEGYLTFQTCAGRAPFVMRRQLILILSFVFILSSALAVYGACAPTHVNGEAEHEAPSIHCPGVGTNPVAQVSNPARSYSSDLSNVLASRDGSAHARLTNNHAKETPFIRTFSQKDLYLLERVYRI